MARKKHVYTWVGGGQNIEPETDASTSTSEVIQLIPPQPTSEVTGMRQNSIIDAIYLHFSIHRLLITELDALGFLVYQEPVAEGAAQPVQALNALSTTDRLYSNKRIMMMAPLPVPRIALSSDLLSATVDEQVLVAHHEYQAQRKHDRSSQVLCLTVNADVSVVVSVFCQWRVLLRWDA